MRTRTTKSILDRLPKRLAFLKPCVREMRRLRVGYRPPVDPKEHPEEARDREIERFLKRDTDILGRHLADALPTEDPDAFYGRARELQFMLLKWLKPYHERCDDPEVALLHVIVGFLAYPPSPKGKLVKKKPRRALARRTPRAGAARPRPRS